MNKQRKLSIMKEEHRQLSEEMENIQGCLDLKDKICPELVERKKREFVMLVKVVKSLEERIYNLM